MTPVPVSSHDHDTVRPQRGVFILGAGPAGLTAAYELQRLNTSDDETFVPKLFEASDMVGGIARTETSNGYRFDIGGHRFFTKVPEVEAMWHEVMGEDMITVPRLSRIYYRGKFFSYPLRIFNALENIGAYESMRIMLSYLKWQVRPTKEENTFEEWVINRFGGRLYMHFFKSYTHKVWGIPPSSIRADWAAQRIKNLSLTKAVWNAVSGSNDTASLIEKFQYPRLGPGQMWERTRDLVRERGGTVSMNQAVSRITRDETRITAIETVDTTAPDGEVQTHPVGDGDVISSMALRDLIHAFDPPPPPDVVEAANRLRYRDFLIVTLVLNKADPFPDNWIYVHAPEVKVGRIQNFRAWSAEMLPDQQTASIGMEYFCQKGDGLWTMSDAELQALAGRELQMLELAREEDVIGAAIIRQPKAYPVYDGDYADALATVREWLLTLENFQTVGRNGLHRYNNQDHSMLSAIYAARNLVGDDHDIWNVNVDRSYHEEFEVQKTGSEGSRKRRSKQRVSA